MMIRFILYIFFAQQLFSIGSLEKNTVYKNEPAQIKFTFPNFNQYKVLSLPKIPGIQFRGPSISSFYHIINGNKSSGKSLTFTLHHEGKAKVYTIPPITILIDGKEFKSKVQRLTVLAQTKFTNPWFGGMQNHYQREGKAEVSISLFPQKIYQGQPATLRYKVITHNFTKPALELTLPLPKFANIHSSLFERPNVTGSQIGNSHQFYSNLEIFIIPLKTGSIYIDSHTGQVTDELKATRDIPITFKKTIIQVKALPQKNKPKQFTGNIGTFQLNYQYIDDQSNQPYQQNKPLIIRLDVKGKGNFIHFSKPDIQYEKQWFSLIDSREIKKESTKDGLNPKGYITYEYKLLPLRSGSFSPGTFITNWFNPYEEKYQQATLPMASLHFSPSKKIQNVIQKTHKKEIQVLPIFLFIGFFMVVGIVFLFREKIIPIKIQKKINDSIQLLQSNLYDTTHKKEKITLENDRWKKQAESICGKKKGTLCQEYLLEKGLTFQEVQEYKRILTKTQESSTKVILTESEKAFLQELIKKVKV